MTARGSTPEEYYKTTGETIGQAVTRIHQSDSCLIEAPSVLSGIADNILKFNVNHKEE